MKKAVLSLLLALFLIQLSGQTDFYISSSGGYNLVEGEGGRSIDFELGKRYDKVGLGINYTKYNARFQENPLDGATSITIEELYLSSLDNYYHKNVSISQEVLSLVANYDIITNEEFIFSGGFGISYFWHKEIDLRINAQGTSNFASYYTKPINHRGWNLNLKALYKVKEGFYLGVKSKLENIVDYNVGLLFSAEARI